MIILYSNDCPRCNILKAKLTAANIKYSTSNDVNKLIENGFDMFPVLQLDNKLLSFGEAVKWINSQGVINGTD